MKCYNHADIDAIGVCTVCGKMVCNDCAIMVNGKMVCKSCIESQATITPATVSGNKKELVISLLLSFFLPGAGQIYNGQVKKGLIMLAGYWISTFTVIVLCFVLVGFCLLPFLAAFQIYNIYDAVMTAEKINRGECVRDWLD